MPKVDDFVIHLKGVEHVCPVYYTKTDKRFRITNFPSEVTRPLGITLSKGAIYGTTQDEAEKTALEYLDKFNNLQVTEERVIVINWMAKGSLREEGEGAHLKPYIYVKHWTNQMHGSTRFNEPRVRTALAYSYRLLVKRTNAFREHPYYTRYDPEIKYRPSEESIKSHEVILPWTPEAEEFCNQFELMLVNSIKKMSDFLHQDPIELEAKILAVSGALPFYDLKVDNKEVNKE